MVSHIYFDWSGTLAKSDGLRRKTRKARKARKARRTRRKGDCKMIYSDVKPMLEYLYLNGYMLGMITNSDKDVSYLVTCLIKYGLMPYFKGAIVVASMKDMKEKPRSIIFKKALDMDGIRPSDALMVGNKYNVDVEGAKGIGMKTAFVDRKNKGPTGKEDIYIQNILELGLYLK